MSSEAKHAAKRKKWGDRRDGTLVREMDGVHHIMPYLFPRRADSEVYINEQMDVTALLSFLEKKNSEGKEELTDKDLDQVAGGKFGDSNWDYVDCLMLCAD